MLTTHENGCEFAMGQSDLHLPPDHANNPDLVQNEPHLHSCHSLFMLKSFTLCSLIIIIMLKHSLPVRECLFLTDRIATSLLVCFWRRGDQTLYYSSLKNIPEVMCLWQIAAAVRDISQMSVVFHHLLCGEVAQPNSTKQVIYVFCNLPIPGVPHHHYQFDLGQHLSDSMSM